MGSWAGEVAIHPQNRTRTHTIALLALSMAVAG